MYNNPIPEGYKEIFRLKYKDRFTTNFVTCTLDFESYGSAVDWGYSHGLEEFAVEKRYIRMETEKVKVWQT